MENKRNGERFVTYKWLIGTTLAAMVLMTSINGAVIGFVYGIIDQRLSQRVGRAEYSLTAATVNSTLCDVKSKLEEADKRLDSMEKSLARIEVMVGKVR